MPRICEMLRQCSPEDHWNADKFVVSYRKAPEWTLCHVSRNRLKMEKSRLTGLAAPVRMGPGNSRKYSLVPFGSKGRLGNSLIKTIACITTQTPRCGWPGAPFFICWTIQWLCSAHRRDTNRSCLCEIALPTVLLTLQLRREPLKLSFWHSAIPFGIRQCMPASLPPWNMRIANDYCTTSLITLMQMRWACATWIFWLRWNGWKMNRNRFNFQRFRASGRLYLRSTFVTH